MLPLQPYHPGTYPPAGPRWVKFGDDLVEHTLTAAEKRANRRQGMLNFHFERLKHGGLIPMKVREHVPGVEMDVQTENYTEDRGTQWERPRDAKGNPIPDQGSSEDEEGGGERGNGGSSASGSRGPNLLKRATTGAAAGARHMAGPGYAIGTLGGAAVTGIGYLAGGVASLGFNGLKGGANFVGNVLGGEGGAADSDPTPDPVTAPATSRVHQEPKPAEPVPPWLLDREEREAAARQPTIVGQWASKQQDKKRLDKQRAKDELDARRADAEAVIARHL